MCGFLLRLFINATLHFTLIAALPGMVVDTFGASLAGSAAVGAVNAAIRPAVVMAALHPGTPAVAAVTLAANFFAPLLAEQALPGVRVSSVTFPLVGALVMTLCSVTLTRIIQDR